jgi:hypothetical protein
MCGTQIFSANDRFKGNDFDSKNIVSLRIVKWSDGPRLTTLQRRLPSVPNSSDRDGQTMFDPCDAKTIAISIFYQSRHIDFARQIFPANDK